MPREKNMKKKAMQVNTSESASKVTKIYFDSYLQSWPKYVAQTKEIQ